MQVKDDSDQPTALHELIRMIGDTTNLISVHAQEVEKLEKMKRSIKDDVGFSDGKRRKKQSRKILNSASNWLVLEKTLWTCNDSKWKS